MAGQTVDFNAIAKQFGGVSATPASAPSGPIDYAALAKQHGAAAYDAPQSGAEGLKSEGLLESAWKALTSPIHGAVEMMTPHSRAEKEAQVQKALNWADRFVAAHNGGTDAEKKAVNDEGMVSLPFGSTVYKAKEGNYLGAAGDVAGVIMLGGIAKAAEPVTSGVQAMARVATDPAVVRAGVRVLPKGRQILAMKDAFDKAKSKVAAAKTAAERETALREAAATIPPDVMAELTRDSEVPAAAQAPDAVPQGQPLRPGKGLADYLPIRNQSSRRASAAVPETGTPEGIARAMAEREAIIGKPREQWTNADVLTADELRAQGFTGAAQPAPAPQSAPAMAHRRLGWTGPEAPPPPPSEAALPIPVEPPPDAATVTPAPRTIAQNEAAMMQKGAPPLDPQQSQFHANGEAKSPEFRAQEKIRGNTTAKATRWADALEGEQISPEDARNIEGGRVSDAQLQQGAAPRWENVKDYLIEKGLLQSGETVPKSSMPEIIAELQKRAKVKPALPAEAPPANSGVTAKSPRDITRAELAKQAGLPENATTQEIMEAMAKAMEEDKPKAAAAPTPRFLFHGTSSVHADSIQANGLTTRANWATGKGVNSKGKVYVSPFPEIAADEAWNTVYGDEATETAGAGGDRTLVVLDRSKLRDSGLTRDPEMSGGDWKDTASLYTGKDVPKDAIVGVFRGEDAIKEAMAKYKDANVGLAIKAGRAPKPKAAAAAKGK